MSDSVKQSWSLIVPCFNEYYNLADVVDKANNTLEKMASDSEIIIVDDGSTDGTKELLHDLIKKYRNVKVIEHKENLGLGRTLKDGYLNATKENVCSIGGDGQFNVAELESCAVIPENVIISFRRQNKVDYTPFRYFLSNTHRFLNRLMLGITVTDINWVLVFKTRAIQSMNLKLNSTLVKSEMCAKLVSRGYKFKEVDSVSKPRVFGSAKGANFKMIFQALSELFMLLYVVWFKK